MRLHLIVLAIASLPLIQACNESNFGSSSGTAAKPASNDDDVAPPSTSVPENECVEGDKINFEWSGPAKECIVDEGKTYNFDSETCMEMRAAEFDCNWETVKSEMKKLGLASKVMEKDSNNGAKLVSCGQSEDSNRIVIQWINQPSGGGFDCKTNANKGNVVTGCYTRYAAQDDIPPPPKNRKEQEEQVYGCMNKL